jgi:aspartate racemase
MPLHIGIVACSGEGAALCYRTIVLEGAALVGEHDHPEVSMHNHPLARSMELIYKNDWQGVGELMLDSARRLKTIGADFAICPDNTVHQALDLVRSRSPLPWLHIAEEIAREASERGFKKVGLTGTKYLMEGPVYPPRFASYGIEQVIPKPEQRAEINRIIFEELVNGKFTPAALAYFQGVIREFQAQGCEAVALCCTEIPLLVRQEDSPLPVLDSTRLLARAAVRKALAESDAHAAAEVTR